MHLKGVIDRCVVVVLVLIAFPGFGQDKLDLTQIASGFSIPVAMGHVGDDRLFIVEKNGAIRIMDTLGQVFAQPFLDIDPKVNSGASERGLLGLAFHPAYDVNGYFFVNYSNNSGATTIARYTRDSTDINLADPNSEIILMTIPQPFSNHNGGHLAFGPDGYLYIGTGDGGNGGDPGDRSQNLNLLLGKMLRIDVDGAMPYDIPADNPFAGSDTTLQEIWAYGLRNPWKYCFDRATGDLWIADVGQDSWEEVHEQPAASTGGENYGWRCKEGFANFNTSGCPPPESLTAPVFAYAHSGSSCSGSVTGGFVYRGQKHPYFIGKYLFTDYCTGVFRAVELDTSGAVTSEELANLQNQEFTSFGEDAAGELYVAGASGRIYTVSSLVSAVNDLRSMQIRIFPNPAAGHFRIDRGPGLSGEIHVTILNSLGAVVDRVTCSSDSEIDCTALAPGIYTIAVDDRDEGRRVGKLVIAR